MSQSPQARLVVWLSKGVLPTVDVQTGTLQLVCEFPNPDGRLRPGQFGRIRMAIAMIEGAVLVPQKAIVERQGVKSVLIVDAENKVALRTVTITERYEGQFVVEDGLDGHERVIVEGLQKAIPGSIVAPTEDAASDEPTPEDGDSGGNE